MRKQPADAQSEEYRNFRNLTAKLVAVPKSELDKQKAAHEAKKKRKKERPAK